MSIKREIPEVNAGSMADIAFLLLIFFLVTTTLKTDEGFNRLLPPKEPGPEIELNERNVLRVNINSDNQLMVEDNVVDITSLRDLTQAFIDNGGMTINGNNYCDYCKGNRDKNSSDNPSKAIIFLSHKRETTYGFYIMIQNELIGAYNELRNREAKRLFNQGYVQMEEEYHNQNTHSERKVILKKQIKKIQELYPQKIIENEVFNN